MKTRYYLNIPRQAREKIQPCIPCSRNVSDYMRPKKNKGKTPISVERIWR